MGLFKLFKKKRQRTPKQYMPGIDKVWNSMCPQERQPFLNRASKATSTKVRGRHYKHGWTKLPEKVRTVLKKYWGAGDMHKVLEAR